MLLGFRERAQEGERNASPCLSHAPEWAWALTGTQPSAFLVTGRRPNQLSCAGVTVGEGRLPHFCGVQTLPQRHKETSSRRDLRGSLNLDP